jgi:ATP-dependent Zn protease
MDLQFLNQKDDKNKGKKGKENPKFLGSVASTVLIFMILVALYLAISNPTQTKTEIPISELAKSVTGGEVKKILVEGEKLTITYNNDEVKQSKKEVESSLSQTLFNYGVQKEALATVELEIKNESGLGYWLLNILPFLLPILFFIFIFWYLSRSVKGAGMQAFTFGQSKARVVAR